MSDTKDVFDLLYEIKDKIREEVQAEVMAKKLTPEDTTGMWQELKLQYGIVGAAELVVCLLWDAMEDGCIRAKRFASDDDDTIIEIKPEYIDDKCVYIGNGVSIVAIEDKDNDTCEY